MSGKTNHLRIGIVVLVAIGLFIAGLLAFGARTHFIRTETMETGIEGDVSGLAVGSKVLLRGVPVGRVSNIDFARNIYPASQSRLIVVEFKIERPIFAREESPEQKGEILADEVERGLRAMVKAQGITGTSILAIDQLDPAKNPPPPRDFNPRHPYIPSAPGQFTRILESIEQSLQNIQKLNFESVGVGAASTLAEATRLLQTLNRIDLQNTVDKADAALDEIRATVVTADSAIKNMKLDALGQSIEELLVGLRDSNVRLQTVLENAGGMQLRGAVEDVRSTVQTLDEVLLQLKRYPSGFIFGKPPPPAKSVEPPSR